MHIDFLPTIHSVRMNKHAKDGGGGGNRTLGLYWPGLDLQASRGRYAADNRFHLPMVLISTGR